jgi:FkbM family methyltransferase
MAAVVGLLKPCYVFAPRTLLRRIGLSLLPWQISAAGVRLPWGAQLEVNPNEGIGRELLRQGVFDIAVSETAWRLLEPGDLAVDVGANIGYMTSLFAARVGTQGCVESFEPHPRIFARLRQNVESLRRSGPPAAEVTLHDCALGDTDGRTQLIEPRIFGINEGASTVTPAPGGLPGAPAEGSFEIRIARFDTVLNGRQVGLLKVDVEGFEAQVLGGAQRALARRRIRHLIYEAHECERSPLHALLAGYGYSIFGIGHELFGPKLTPGAAAPRIDRRWESPSYLATLAPREAALALRTRGWRVLRAC